MFIYIHTYIYIHVHTYIHTCMHAYMIKGNKASSFAADTRPYKATLKPKKQIAKKKMQLWKTSLTPFSNLSSRFSSSLPLSSLAPHLSPLSLSPSLPLSPVSPAHFLFRSQFISVFE